MGKRVANGPTAITLSSNPSLKGYASMDKEITIRITGEAGQGIQTVGTMLCSLFRSCGLHIFANQDYMSRIRGGNNYFQIRIKDAPVFTLREKPDIIVALDAQSVALHKTALAAGGCLVLDKKKFNISESDDAFFDVPLYDLATNVGGSEIFLNTVSCGVVTAITGIEFKYLSQVIQIAFGFRQFNSSILPETEIFYIFKKLLVTNLFFGKNYSGI